MSHYGPPKGSKSSHYGPPKQSHYGPPDGGSSQRSQPVQPPSHYGPSGNTASPLNLPNRTTDAAPPRPPPTKKASRFDPLPADRLADSTTGKRAKEEPEAGGGEESAPAKRARSNRFAGVFDPRAAPQSKVAIPQADHPNTNPNHNHNHNRTFPDPRSRRSPPTRSSAAHTAS